MLDLGAHEGTAEAMQNTCVERTVKGWSEAFEGQKAGSHVQGRSGQRIVLKPGKRRRCCKSGRRVDYLHSGRRADLAHCGPTETGSEPAAHSARTRMSAHAVERAGSGSEATPGQATETVAAQQEGQRAATAARYELDRFEHGGAETEGGDIGARFSLPGSDWSTLSHSGKDCAVTEFFPLSRLRLRCTSPRERR
jgi:hypothetical protein